MTENKLKKINELHDKIKYTESIIDSCKRLKKLTNIQLIMTSDFLKYHNESPYLDMVLSNDEMRMMDTFFDQLIFKKEKELTVLNEQFSKY